MMQTRPAIRPGARSFGGAVLLLFVVAVFAPLGSALAQCAMPCCHSSAEASLDRASPCPPESCTISAAPEAVAAVAPEVSQASAPAVLVTLADVAELPSTPAGDVHPLVATSPPRALHLLNSVFLI